MICAAVMVCTGHSVWLICQHCPEKDSSETICPDLRGEVMPGLLHYRFLACSPETTLHHQNEQAANDEQQITGVATDFSLKESGEDPQKRECLSRPSQGKEPHDLRYMWEVCRRAALRQETPHHSKPRLDNSLLRSLATTLLSEVTRTWGITVSILFQTSKIFQSSVLKGQLLFPLQVLPKGKFFPPWSTTNVLRTKDAVSAVLFKQIPQH